MKGHRTIPVFLPELACPYRCTYCNQHRITGAVRPLSPQQVPELIERHLATIDPRLFDVELGYFGGSFTGLPVAEQEAYLSAAIPYIDDGRIGGIRLSTRPDYIDEDRLRMLSRYGVRSIELGAQSMDDAVLRLARRGHTKSSTEEAASLILKHGFRLGLQMMVGLPGSSQEAEMETARRFAELGAMDTRIYPVVVLRDTELADLYREGRYQPLELNEAAIRAARLIDFFSGNGINILRVGLHPSDELLSGESLLAGPFHPAFGAMALSKLWQTKLRPLTLRGGDELTLSVRPESLADAAGFRKENRAMLERYFRTVRFVGDKELLEFAYHADIR